MAEKRRLRVPEQNSIEEIDQEELPRKFRNISWNEWLKMDFARYWFVLVALMIDLLFGFDAMSLVSGAGTLGVAIFLAFTVPAEILIYIYLWGKKGKWMPEK